MSESDDDAPLRPKVKPVEVPPHIAKAAKRLRAKARKKLEGLSAERVSELAGTLRGMADPLPDDYGDAGRFTDNDKDPLGRPHMIIDGLRALFSKDPGERARAQARLGGYFSSKFLDEEEDDHE